MNEKIKLEKNDTVEIEIDDFGMNGEGVAHYEGVTIFIRGALVGERVRAKIILVRPAFLIGIVDEILRESAARTVHPCPVFGKCGGCSLQHLRYKEQLLFKQARVKNTLKKVGGISADVQATVPSDRQYRYRNKLSLPVRGTPPAVGFFAANSHRVVPVSDCKIQFEKNEKLIALFLRFLNENNLTGYDEITGKGDVRHLVAREIGGTDYVTVITPRAEWTQIKAFNDVLAKEWNGPYALWLNFNKEKNNVIWGERTEFIGGQSAPVCIDGLRVAVHPKSFFQVNDFIRARIYGDVKKQVVGKVLEAYSGAGVLSAILSKVTESVIAVEREKAAVLSAQALVKENNISGVTLITGDCAEEIPRLTAQMKGERFTVVLDPPRAGCDRRVTDAVAASGAERVVYVSCSPATLARDLAVLLSGGYRLTLVQPYDMFPQTPEVETFCVLQRADACDNT